MNAIRRDLVAAFLSMALTAVPGHAQEVVPDSEACPRCSLIAEPVAQIGEREGNAALPTAPLAITVDSQERYWLAFFQPPIMVFDPMGRFLRSVGRNGDGPGEFRRPYAIAADGEVILVFEQSGRVTTLDLDFQHVRTALLPSVSIWEAAIFEWPGRVLLNGVLGPPSGIRLPFNMASFSGDQVTITQTFGPDLEDRERRGGQRNLRHLFDVPRGDSIWVAEERRYQVSRWRADGERLETLVRQPEWFSGRSTGSPGGPNTPPNPVVIGLASDPENYVWVFLRVAGPRWRQAWQDAIARAGGSVASVGPDPDRYPAPWDLYSTIVEVLDPKSRRVIYRQIFEPYVVEVLPGPRVVAYSEPDLIPSIEILALRLEEMGAVYTAGR